MNKHVIILNKRILFLILVSLSLTPLITKAQKRYSDLRVKKTINDNWKYYEFDSNSITDFNLQKEGESALISLPHTWNAFDAVDQTPGYRRGGSWYEKKISITKQPTKRYFLHFEGVNTYCEVYLNNTYVGKHTGGYISFEFDITPLLSKTNQNLIQVFVSNRINPDIIPSQKADFIIYGGITRDVWLIESASIHFYSNIKITPITTKERGEVSIVVPIISHQNKSINCTLIANLVDANKNVVASTSLKTAIKDSISIVLPNISILNPNLWSPKDPYLYSIQLILKNETKVMDSLTHSIGFRWFEFKAYGSFYLNGERMLLRGTHRHEEYAGLGNALPNRLHKKDIAMIKEIGANFIRLAHYPQDPEVYKTCDSLGILVWDELPWCRGGMGGTEWKINTTKMLSEIILQNYNHSSIIMWSLGNEIDWLPDRKEYSSIDSITTFLKFLNTLAHQLDSSRVTCIRKYYNGANVVDVFSPSIWAGWYAGNFQDYEYVLTNSQKKYPYFIHAEYGGDSHFGRHTTKNYTENISGNTNAEEMSVQTSVLNKATIGDWSETYINELFDWHLKTSEQNDSLTSTIQWAFKDFATPLRPENPIPYINQKGLMDRAGNPKDGYYIFKSYWTTSPQFCYLESHTQPYRFGNTNKSQLIKVYSNCDSVKLIVNGQNMGIKAKNIKLFPASGLTWNVKLKKGTNTIKAEGIKNTIRVCKDSITQILITDSLHSPEKINLSYTLLPNGNYLIKAMVVDKFNNPCLNYSKRIYFNHQGDGTLLLNQGTPNGSNIIEAANGMAYIEFIPPIKGASIIEVRNQDFKGEYLNFTF